MSLSSKRIDQILEALCPICYGPVNQADQIVASDCGDIFCEDCFKASFIGVRGSMDGQRVSYFKEIFSERFVRDGNVYRYPTREEFKQISIQMENRRLLKALDRNSDFREELVTKIHDLDQEAYGSTVFINDPRTGSPFSVERILNGMWNAVREIDFEGGVGGDAIEDYRGYPRFINRRQANEVIVSAILELFTEHPLEFIGPEFPLETMEATCPSNRQPIYQVTLYETEELIRQRAALVRSPQYPVTRRRPFQRKLRPRQLTEVQEHREI